MKWLNVPIGSVVARYLLRTPKMPLGWYDWPKMHAALRTRGRRTR